MNALRFFSTGHLCSSAVLRSNKQSCRQFDKGASSGIIWRWLINTCSRNGQTELKDFMLFMGIVLIKARLHYVTQPSSSLQVIQLILISITLLIQNCQMYNNCRFVLRVQKIQLLLIILKKDCKMQFLLINAMLISKFCGWLIFIFYGRITYLIKSISM